MSDRPKSNEEIILEANELARKFYKMLGKERSEDFNFFSATHPEEARMWNQAVIAYDHINGADVENALDELGEFF